MPVRDWMAYIRGRFVVDMGSCDFDRQNCPSKIERPDIAVVTAPGPISNRCLGLRPKGSLTPQGHHLKPSQPVQINGACSRSTAASDLEADIAVR